MQLRVDTRGNFSPILQVKQSGGQMDKSGLSKRPVVAHLRLWALLPISIVGDRKHPTRWRRAEQINFNSNNDNFSNAFGACGGAYIYWSAANRSLGLFGRVGQLQGLDMPAFCLFLGNNMRHLRFISSPIYGFVRWLDNIQRKSFDFCRNLSRSYVRRCFRTQFEPPQGILLAFSSKKLIKLCQASWIYEYIVI